MVHEEWNMPGAMGKVVVNGSITEPELDRTIDENSTAQSYLSRCYKVEMLQTAS